MKDMNDDRTEESIGHDEVQQCLPSGADFELQEDKDKDTISSFSQSTDEEFESLSEQGTDMQLAQSISPEGVSEKMMSVWSTNTCTTIK